MSRRHLLLCFDAFGTLFTPRKPVHQQYAEVARSLGLSGIKDDDVQAQFKKAFKHEAKQNPNFGKANGMNAERWWTNIITNTFQPLVAPGQQLPAELAPKLLHRFWCDEGYMMFPDVVPFLQHVRQVYTSHDSRIVIGVITNSDDRVPDILSGFGLRVNALRYGSKPTDSIRSETADHDIDFSVMSYDVGHEKPDRRIFVAAEEMLRMTVEAKSEQGAAPFEPSQWQKVYVGDEYAKDVVGALGAGWSAILVDRESAERNSNIKYLDDAPSSSLFEELQHSKSVGCSSLAKLTEWMLRT